MFLFRLLVACLLDTNGSTIMMDVIPLPIVLSSNDKINFDGLNVVALFHSPGNMLTGPKWDATL